MCVIFVIVKLYTVSPVVVIRSAVRVREYHSRKIFENSDAKSCILVNTCCEISCFLKTTDKKLGGSIHTGPPIFR